MYESELHAQLIPTEFLPKLHFLTHQPNEPSDLIIVLEYTITLWALENVCQRKYTPLYEKGIKQNQNMPMETTIDVFKKFRVHL